MKPYPLVLTDGVLFIDNSNMELVQTCLRKAGYGLSRRKELARDKTALKFGGIMHKALEARYIQGTIITPQIEADMIRVLQQEFLDWQPEDPMDFRNLDQAVECIQRYNKTYPSEHFTIEDIEGHKGTETPFAVPFGILEVRKELYTLELTTGNLEKRYIDELPIFYTGRIDMLVSDSMGLWLFDHKTTSIGGSNFFAPFYISSQFKGYAWAIKQIKGLESYPLGVIINGIVNRKPTRTGKAIEFIRDDIYLQKENIDEWYESTYDNLNLYIHCIAEQRFPMQTTACVGKYGRCEFYDVCLAAPAHREILLNSGQYNDRTWNPISGD